MLFQDPKFSLENVKSYFLSRQNFWTVLKFIYTIKYRCTKPFNRSLTVAQKIKYRYSVGIGIAILGTSGGIIVGDYYQQQALNQLTLIHRETQLLSDLENALFKLHFYQQKLINNGHNNSNLTPYFENVDRLFLQLKYLQNNYNSNLTLNQTNLQSLINQYRNLSNSNKMGISSTNFAEILRKLTELKTTANRQEIKVNNQFKTVNLLRILIILFSIILSVVIATLLGFHSSNQIVRPLEWVHQVALRVTQQSNFKLIAPVISEDEFGSLASSINKLVQWVGEYTHQLEIARQTLEHKVTERTQELEQTLQELKQTQAQLIQSEKMTSLGNLVAGIAHEINNPTNFIYGNIQHISEYIQELFELIQLYQKYYPTAIPEIEEKIVQMDLDFIAEDLPKILDSMQFGTERIRRIIVSLRNFSRLDEAEMKLVDIHEGIENTLLILSHRINQEIKVKREYNSLPFVECFPAQINQVLLHIISNAIDALEEVNQIKVAIEDNFSPQIIIKTQQLAENLIQIQIKDNGVGIASEVKNKIFDPFFTTKPIGKGSGLGLFVCYNVVQKHQGKLEVISELGKGTEFNISLPIKV